jgi:glycosyltransferase involved in cell wall biosynthesis
LKILIITDAWHPQINGVVRTYEYLHQELSRLGHEVKIIGPNDFSLNMPMPGYAEIRLTLFPYHRLSKMIGGYAPDLLHIGTEGPLGMSARKYARKNKLSFTSSYHTHFPDYAAKRAAKFLPFLYNPVRRLSIAFIRWFHKNSSCLFVATKSLEETLREWNFACPMKPMTRGADFETFHPGEKNLFSEFKSPVALYVGRVAIEKNLESFLDMEWNGSKVIVGTGPDLSSLKNKYPSAHFAGKHTEKNLADHYRSADLFVFPSKTDTFGMVLVEAMACGLPIAAYPVTGPVDIVTEPFLGALDEDLSIAAKNAMSSHGTKAARFEFAKNRYSWGMAAQQFLDID